MRRGLRSGRGQVPAEFESGNYEPQDEDRARKNRGAESIGRLRGAVKIGFGVGFGDGFGGKRVRFRNRFHSRGRIEVRFDAGEGAAALWIGAQAFPANREEGLGKVGRYFRFTALRSVPDG